jgi:hypothetical protein
MEASGQIHGLAAATLDRRLDGSQRQSGSSGCYGKEKNLDLVRN